MAVPLVLPESPQQQLLLPLGKMGKVWRGPQSLQKTIAKMGMEPVDTGPLISRQACVLTTCRHCPSPGLGEVTHTPTARLAGSFRKLTL